jgi:hypothetical protein
MDDPFSVLNDIGSALDRPAWKVFGQDMLEVIRDMLLENGESKLCGPD